MESQPTNAVPAASGPRPRAKKKERRRSKASRSRSAKPAPTAVPEQKAGGLLDGLGDLFNGRPSASSSSNPSAEAASSQRSTDSSPTSSSDPLPAEVEAKLSAVPDVIGATEPEPGDGAELGRDDIDAMMASVAFAEEDVRDLCEEFFEALAARFHSDHWKLSERQSRILVRPLTQLLNSVWAKLRERIPDLLARWCEDMPGLTGTLLAAGIVIGPKVAKQVRIPRTQPAAPKQVEAAREPAVTKQHSAPAGPAIPVRGGIIGEAA